MLNPLHIVGALVRGHALRGTGLTHKIAQALTGESARSPHWPTIERRWKKLHPACAACGSTLLVQVHHIHSFATYPENELWDCSGVPPGTGPVGGTPNFITLCAGRGHHLNLGHGGSYQHGGFNPHVVLDASEVLRCPWRSEQINARARMARVSPPLARDRRR